MQWHGLEEIIRTGEFSNDFFSAKIRTEGFTTLISKTPSKDKTLDFNLFGYMKLNPDSYFYNVDIANSGSIYSHQELFKATLNNIINFIKG